jgi:hypothetical protein
MMAEQRIPPSTTNASGMARRGEVIGASATVFDEGCGALTIAPVTGSRCAGNPEVSARLWPNYHLPFAIYKIGNGTLTLVGNKPGNPDVPKSLKGNAATRTFTFKKAQPQKDSGAPAKAR